MRILSVLALSLVMGLVTTGCGKKKAAVAADAASGAGAGTGGGTGGGTTTTPKDLLSSWTQGAFTLDFTSGNSSGTSFTAHNTISGQVCSLTMTLGAPDAAGVGDCEVTAAAFDNADSTSPDGTGSNACAQNPANTCGAAVGVMGSYTWDGTTLTFPSNGINYQ